AARWNRDTAISGAGKSSSLLERKPIEAEHGVVPEQEQVVGAVADDAINSQEWIAVSDWQSVELSAVPMKHNVAFAHEPNVRSAGAEHVGPLAALPSVPADTG